MTNIETKTKPTIQELARQTSERHNRLKAQAGVPSTPRRYDPKLYQTTPESRKAAVLALTQATYAPYVQAMLPICNGKSAVYGAAIGAGPLGKQYPSQVISQIEAVNAQLELALKDKIPTKNGIISAKEISDFFKGDTEKAKEFMAPALEACGLYVEEPTPNNYVNKKSRIARAGKYAKGLTTSLIAYATRFAGGKQNGTALQDRTAN